MKPEPTTSRAGRALLCAAFPGVCVAQAVHDAGVQAGAAARREAQAAAQTAAAAAGAAGGSAATIFTGFGDGLRDVIREGAAPVESTASAIRFGSVALAVMVVALVVLGLVLAWKF